MVYSSASARTRQPFLRAVALVMGPMQAAGIRGGLPENNLPKFSTVDELVKITRSYSPASAAAFSSGRGSTGSWISMGGIAITSAPCFSNARIRQPACLRDRVTTIRLPLSRSAIDVLEDFRGAAFQKIFRD